MPLNPSTSSIIEKKGEFLDKHMEEDLPKIFPESSVNNKILVDGMLGNCIGSCFENLSDAIPSLDLNSEGCCRDPSHLDQPPSCPYNLRSLASKPVSFSVVGGIDPHPPQSQPGKKRGRKSKISAAKVQAIYDVADGK